MMIPISPAQYDLIGGALAFFFTVALLSYLIGDNPLYRIALHLFVGVAAGYSVLVVVFQVLRPRLIQPLLGGDMVVIALASVPLLLFVFLILKVSPRTAALGNLAIAYLIGVGTAVALGGALTGTLIPQVRSTWLSIMPGAGLGFLSNGIIALGAILTLLYFQFWLRGRSQSGDAERTPLMHVAAQVGQGFIVLTLAAIYGGMILSGIAIFSERLTWLAGWASSFVR
jgi:hypothetical protein